MQAFQQFKLLGRVVCLIALLSPGGRGDSALKARIHTGINEGEVFALKGNTRPAVQSGLAHDKGKVEASLALPRMVMHFAMTPAQRADLDQLLEAQQDRRSPHYHRFLTPEQYAARFGLAGSDVAKVTNWLESSGFSNLQVAHSGNWVSFSGTARQAESAFHVSLHHYSLNGETHFANTADPQLPKQLEGVVENVRGLHSFTAKPFVRRAKPNLTTTPYLRHYVSPDDWTTIYDVKPLYAAGLDGTGVTIAVLGQSQVHMTDIETFRAVAGLPANNPKVIVPPGVLDPGVQNASGDELESAFDLEWAGAIAKNAQILLITSSATYGNGVADSLAYAVDNNVAPIVSISYGQCEADLSPADFQAQNGLLQQANAQGMTVVAASGDDGAAACDQGAPYATHGKAVSFPASSAYVTGVGGTQLNYDDPGWASTNNSLGGSAQSYIAEEAWGFSNFYFEEGRSGGGASALISKPAWQTGQGVPADSARDVPDVAFAASYLYDGLLACFEGSCANGYMDPYSNLLGVGGTSVATPPLAGILAMVIQQHGAAGRLGNINPNLYSLAQVANNNIFHDITDGSNVVQCTPGTPDCPSGLLNGFQAGPGYDQVTGWGSLDAYNFVEQWYGDIQVAVSPTALTIQPGQSASADITLSPQNNFSGPVTFTCSVSAGLVNVTCSIPNPTLNTSGTTTVLINAASTALLPSWKGMRIRPLRDDRWRMAYLAVILVLLSASLLIVVSHPGLRHRPPMYLANAALLLVAVIGAVSCGGADSTPVAVSKGSAGPPAILTLTCTLPPNAMSGVSYSAPCTASGGTGAVTFSISSGALPAGLSLNPATGAITGTPTTVGRSSFTVRVTDSGSPAQTATQAETKFVVAAQEMPLLLTCNLPGSVTNDTWFAGGCSASGGLSPLTFSISSGSLPSGLQLNPATGAITGMPLTLGTTSFSVQVTDNGSPAQTASQTIAGFSVVPGTLLQSCQPPAGFLFLPYQSSCLPTGGTAPFTFTITSGNLPAGLVLNPSTAAITGVPTKLGYGFFTLSVQDSGSPAQSTSETYVFIVSEESPLDAVCTTPDGSAFPGEVPLGSYVSEACNAFLGNPPYTTSFLGVFPPGVSLNPGTSSFKGTVTARGTFNFTMQITDSSSPPMSLQIPFTLIVGPPAVETGVVTITATSGAIVTTSTVNVTVPQATQP